MYFENITMHIFGATLRATGLMCADSHKSAPNSCPDQRIRGVADDWRSCLLSCV